METHGRAAWPNSGAGGTKAYNNADKPGPYYFLGAGDLPTTNDQDAMAVRGAVKAYQRALNRRLPAKWTVSVTGHFDQSTSDAVRQFQSKRPDLVTWGGIGPDTSRAILMPDLTKAVEKSANVLVTPTIVSGIIRHESGWDAGAVGYVDPNDLGLAQINGPTHPDLTDEQRLQPLTAFNFVIDYLNNAFIHFQHSTGTGDDVAWGKYGKTGDVIASYNLGLGGADRWVSQGRPQNYTPKGSSVSRDVWAYIDTVLEG